MADGITINDSAGSASFWRKVFLGSRGIRSGWRLAIFLFHSRGKRFRGICD